MRTKPSVPFGGKYRIIDFALSNCLNSGLRKIYVLTQYKSDSLNQHLYEAWNIFNPELGEFIYSVPPHKKLKPVVSGNCRCYLSEFKFYETERLYLVCCSWW